MTYFSDMREKAKNIKDKDEVIILGIETSCDETSAAVVRNGREVLGHKIASRLNYTKIWRSSAEIAS